MAAFDAEFNVDRGVDDLPAVVAAARAPAPTPPAARDSAAFGVKLDLAGLTERGSSLKASEAIAGFEAGYVVGLYPGAGMGSL